MIDVTIEDMNKYLKRGKGSRVLYFRIGHLMSTRTGQESYTYMRINRNGQVSTDLTLKRLMCKHNEYFSADDLTGYIRDYSSLVMYGGKPEIRRAILLEELS